MMRLSWLTALLVLGGWAAFAVHADEKPKVDCRGSITRLSPANDAAKQRGILGTLLVEGRRDPGVAYDKASVRITTKTTIEKQVGKERKPATFADLKKGARVEMTFTGAVAESYPVQATAAAVLILEDTRK